MIILPRKVSLPMVSRFCIIKRQEETLSHLFLHCRFAFEMWGCILSRFGRSWEMPRIVNQLVEFWQSAFKGDLSPRGKLFWDCVPHVVCWVIWNERDACTFQDKESSFCSVVERVVSLIFSWLSHLPLFVGCKFLDLMFNWDRMVFL